MGNIKYCFAGDDPELQRGAVDVLANCFEVWAQRKIEFGGRFPFREYSFIALTDEDIPVGHLGIIPFETAAADGGVLRCAGVASVAVLPSYRKRGISAELCKMAVRWAVENDFDLMPLYTSVMPVYARHNWKIFPVKMHTLLSPDPDSAITAGWKCGTALTAEEKDFIMACYEKSRTFSGKVVRVHDDYAAESWGRLFCKTNHRWHISDGGFILSVDNVIAEICGDIAVIPGGINRAFLSVFDPAYELLISAGWRVGADAAVTVPECWDGEVVMINALKPSKLTADLAFPLAHKF